MSPLIIVWQANLSYFTKFRSVALSISASVLGPQLSKPLSINTRQVVHVPLPSQDCEMLTLFAFSVLSRLAPALNWRAENKFLIWSVFVVTDTIYLYQI